MAQNNLFGEMGDTIKDTVAKAKETANEAFNQVAKDEGFMMPAPYAVLMQPMNYNGRTKAGNDYEKVNTLFQDYANKLTDQTEEATNIRNAWSIAPQVKLEDGNLNLYGSDAFLKTSEANQLQKILKEMEGSTYNTEDLNKQIEAWNATLNDMSKEYLGVVSSMNQANAALAQSAQNSEYHKLTFSDMQKIGNSAAIGKRPDAKTTKDKIFVGFDWDEDGNMIERWVDAKDFYEEFNSIDDDKKRREYRDLIVQANNGDVGAYSKLTYLNGGSEGKPANVEYDAVGDFFHTLGENMLTGLAEAADFVTTYVPFFNTYRLTGRVRRAAESGDINEFFKSDDVRNAIDDYEEVLTWENAYLSEMTPGSTELAAGIGSVAGNVLGLAYSIWAGGVGNSAANAMITQGISRANQALQMTGKFTAFERVTTGVGQASAGGNVMAAGSRAQFMMPTALVQKFPNFSAALADKALSVMQITGVGATGTMSEALSVGDRVATITTDTVAVPGSFTAGVARELPNGIVATAFDGGATASRTVLSALSGKALLSERMFANGIRAAFRLTPLAGETALRHTDQYLQKVNAGEDPGDMASYIIENTIPDIIWGGAFMGAGAIIRKMRGISVATRISPASAAEGAFNIGSQDSWYAPGDAHFTYNNGRNFLPSGLERDTELQNLVSSIVTANGESIFVSPNRTPVTTSYEATMPDFTAGEGGVAAGGGVAQAEPTSIEFAPIPNTVAENSGKAFGLTAADRITKFEVEPTAGGANLVKTETNLVDNTTVTTKRFYTDIDEAMAEAKKSAVPTASPRTIANSDQVIDIKVAPISINNVAPEVMPKGVSQIRVEPGIVYRSPDSAVDELINIAQQEGWHPTNQDRLYREYEQYVEEARSQQENFLRPTEALDLPKEMYGTDIDGTLRLAAWAKANGYGAIPFKAPATTDRVNVVSRNVKAIVNTPDSKYELPEYNPTNFMYSSDRDYNYPGEFNETKAMWYALGTPPKEFLTSNINRAPEMRKSLGPVQFNAVMGLSAGDILERALAGTGDIHDLPYALEDLLPMFDMGTPPEEILIRYFLGTSYSIGTGFQNGHLGNIESPYNGSLIENVKNKFDLTSKTAHPKVIKMINDLCDMFEKYAPKAEKWLDKYNVAERAQNGQLIIGDNKDLLDAVRKLANDFEVSRQEANAEVTKTGVKDFINKNGKPLYHPIYVAARLKDGVASFSPDSIGALEAADAYLGIDIDEVPEAERDVMTGSKGDFGFIHIPAGTKVSRVLTPNNNGSGVADVQWVVSLDSGVERDNDEFYLNHTNGASYRPSKDEYDPSIYFLHRPRMSGGGHRYEQWEKDYLTLNPEKEGISNFYNVVSPGGTINDLNGELRRKKYAGKIPSDSLLMRVNAVISNIDEEIGKRGEESYDGNGGGIALGSLLDRLNSLIQGRVEYGGNNSYMSWDTTRGIQDDKGLFRKLNSIRDELNNAMAGKFADYKTEVEGVYDASVFEAPVPDSVVSWLEKELLQTAVEFDDQIPKGVLDDFIDIDTLGREGTHTVKDGPMPWVMRGTGLSQNWFNNSSDVYNSIADWKVGKSFDANSIDFYSINPANPFQRQYQSSYGNNNFVISLGLTPGVKVFSYADTDKAFHTSGTDLHRGDGGAITLAYGTRITPVSIRREKNGPVHIIAIATPAGKEYDGPLDREGYNEVKRIAARYDEVVAEPNNFLVTQYGVPYGWFSNSERALQYASEMGERRVYEYSKDADTLERPPVTTDDPILIQAGEPIQRLSAGGYPTEALQQFNNLMIALPALESPEDYTRGVIDVVHQVQQIYNQVALNVDLATIYTNYGKAIAAGETPTALTYEMEAMRPLLQVLDALGHYFDPSGKSLTQEFYLPTALKPAKKVNIMDAILGKDGVVDEDSPVDGGFDDILLDPLRIGDTGFWQKRTGDLFRDADGNFTMEKSGTLEDALIAYTVSALTRGKNKLYIAAQNEVARSKFDKNRSQITSKQALAGLKDADTIRTKAKSIQAKISKDAEALAELKENYSGEESTIDKALKEKNYANELNYTNALNTTAQKLGYVQNLQMNTIPGTSLRFGGNATNFRGITNIRRKMEKINVTGTMWVERYGEKVNVGFGLDATPANFNIYGHFRPEKAINLGTLINNNFDSDRAAVVLLNQINTNIADWAKGDGWDLMGAISEFARETFPLSDYEWYTAQLMKALGQNYNKYHDPEEIFLANVESISKWIRRGTLDTFNNVVKMSSINNLDNRTINALDEAAAYMLIGTPVKRSKTINYAQEMAVWSALGLNPRVAIGNILNEPLRLIDVVGYRGFASAWKTAMNPKEAARINNIIGDLPSRFDNPEMVGLAEKAKSTFGKLKDKASKVALSPLEKSEQFKNILFWAAAERNAKLKFPNDPQKQMQETLRFFNDYAIAGGKGTVPGVATASFGRTLNIFKTFTLRNFDDFVDFVQKVGRGESGNNYWDEKYEKKHGGKGYTDKKGRNKFDPKIAARVIGGRILRSYLFWLLVGSYFGKSFLDSIGGDPTGITDGGFDRGLYDDPDTAEYEGMTNFDNFVNSLPAGFILGALQDLYFAARRRGVESGQFMGIDILNDPRFAQSLESKLPLGIAKNRFADMLDLVDRGYSFSSTGRKTYAAPETALDTLKGFLFGKSTTQNSLAYGKYRYGMVDIWGDLSSGDWMDFAMNANPVGNILGSGATFDTTRKDYTGVFNGGWNDIQTMQLIIQQFKQRQQAIIDDYNSNDPQRGGRYAYQGEFRDLTDEEKLAKAREIRDKKIEEFTNDVTRAIDAFEAAGNTLNDNQITNLMYLFDFHEGEEDDEWNSTIARQRYVEAGLPDYNAASIKRTTNRETGEEKTEGALDRSLILQNAEQGYYGSPKAAARAISDALRDFKGTYKDYNNRVKALNEKYFAARNKNSKSKEAKDLGTQVENLQNEYLEKLYSKLSPVIEKYGTALIGTYDAADALQEYMGNMIPYSSIKKYGQTYSSGNDIVYGQLTEWIQKRWGRNAPTAPSDTEVTNAISEIKSLLDQGKRSQAKDRARAILNRIGRGSLGARREDVETLRSYLYD